LLIGINCCVLCSSLPICNSCGIYIYGIDLAIYPTFFISLDLAKRRNGQLCDCSETLKLTWSAEEDENRWWWAQKNTNEILPNYSLGAFNTRLYSLHFKI
jgi:hypothetical protein